MRQAFHKMLGLKAAAPKDSGSGRVSKTTPVDSRILDASIEDNSMIPVPNLLIGQQTPSLGVFDRWIDTRWKEYSPTGGMIEITFKRLDERTVHLRVSSGGASIGEVEFRFEGPGQGRYCEVKNGVVLCDAAFAYDSCSMTYLPDDPKKHTYRAALIEPDIFVHYEEIDGVQFDTESYAETAFDSDAKLRERALGSVERRRLAAAEVKRRRSQAQY